MMVTFNFNKRLIVRSTLKKTRFMLCLLLGLTAWTAPSVHAACGEWIGTETTVCAPRLPPGGGSGSFYEPFPFTSYDDYLFSSEGGFDFEDFFTIDVAPDPRQLGVFTKEAADFLERALASLVSLASFKGNTALAAVYQGLLTKLQAGLLSFTIFTGATGSLSDLEASAVTVLAGYLASEVLGGVAIAALPEVLIGAGVATATLWLLDGGQAGLTEAYYTIPENSNPDSYDGIWNTICGFTQGRNCGPGGNIINY